MESQQLTPPQRPQESPGNLLQCGTLAINWGIYLYGLYAIFLLMECIDFLAYLHTPAPGFHATYSMVHVAFFIVELIVYISITLFFFILVNLTAKKPCTVVIAILLVTGIRIFMIYYLYWQTEPEVHFVPYIYKKSNGLSGLVRTLMLPSQIIWGVSSTWIWINITRKINASQGDS